MEDKEAVVAQANNMAPVSQQDNSVDVNDKQTFGNFNSAQELYKAYNCLQKEFTKKSQQLSQLSKDKASGTIESSTPPQINSNSDTQQPRLYKSQQDQESKPLQQDEAVNPQPLEVSSSLRKLSDNGQLDKLLADDRFLADYIYNNSEVVDTIVKNYLYKLSSNTAPLVLKGRGGNISLTPPIKPKTIGEASALAHRYFDDK